MALDPRVPVIVGAGQFTHHAESLDDALEPVALMAAAVRAAAADAGLAALPRDVGAVRVVNLFSWRYGNPAWTLAERLGVEARQFAYTAAGGNAPQALVNRTALDIAAGRADLVILAGGEAWRTRMRAKRDGSALDWTRAPDDVAPPEPIGDELDMTHPGEAARGIFLPVQVYPLFETAVRAATGTPPDEHRDMIAALWSRFSTVAATNPHAWIREPMTPIEVAAVTQRNRIVGWPYTKVMNANNDVDMAAALIMCSAQRAESLTIDRDRWVFPHAGSDCSEHQYVSHRWTFSDTPAIRIGGRTALELAGIGIDDVAIVDLYSCFPSAVQLGAAALGLGLDAQLTRTGGLSFAGGPWNNYVMHAIAAVAGELRGRPGDRALVWANGGYATKHSFGVYGTDPPADGFRHARPQGEVDRLPSRQLAEGDDAAGPCSIEAYTVMFDRDGAPEQAIAACLLPDGRRAWATSGDGDTMAALADATEWVGRPGSIDDGTLHV